MVLQYNTVFVHYGKMTKPAGQTHYHRHSATAGAVLAGMGTVWIKITHGTTHVIVMFCSIPRPPTHFPI